MKRTGLARHAGLRATTPLARRAGLAQVGRRRRETAEAQGRPVRPALATKPRVSAPVDVKAVLLERSGGRCEMELAGCLGTGSEVAHRISRKAGGRKGAAADRHDTPSNTLWSCHVCHMWTHSRPAEAYDLGLMLREHQVPTQEPVVRRGVLVYLDDAGGVRPFAEAGV